MSNLGKCIRCGEMINDTHSFCIYCGAKQISFKAKAQEYITYFGGIKVKKTTTTLVGFVGVIIMLLVGVYLLRNLYR